MAAGPAPASMTRMAPSASPTRPQATARQWIMYWSGPSPSAAAAACSPQSVASSSRAAADTSRAFRPARAHADTAAPYVTTSGLSPRPSAPAPPAPAQKENKTHLTLHP